MRFSHPRLALVAYSVYVLALLMPGCIFDGFEEDSEGSNLDAGADTASADDASTAEDAVEDVAPVDASIDAADDATGASDAPGDVADAVDATDTSTDAADTSGDVSDASDAGADAADASMSCVGTGDLAGAQVGDSCNTGQDGVCADGEVICDATGELACEPLEQPSAEVCDGYDNDCDGSSDEGLFLDCARQEGVCAGAQVACVGGGFRACSFSQYGADYERIETLCDGLDNDCDGDVDEDLFEDCPLQDGVCSGSKVACTNGQYPSCTAADYGSDYESVETLCDGLDNDCDGQVDEGCDCVDGDQQPCYGGPSGTAGVGPCQQGTQTCSGGSWGACSGEVTPEAEVCDGFDNDCDGDVDENLFEDCPMQDGVCSGARVACTGGQFPSCTAADYGPGYETDETICEGLDNDCDGEVDEGLLTEYFADQDGDNFGDPTDSIMACSPVGHYDTTNATDCNDNDSNVFPGQTQYFDSPHSGTPRYDYNCDGTNEKRWTDEASIPCSSVGPNYCDNASNPQADGWQDGTAPKCGVNEWYVLGCFSTPTGACVTNRVERTQECR